VHVQVDQAGHDQQAARVDFELTGRPDGGTDVCFSERPIGLVGALTPVLRPSLLAL
jgi:hypothetical protein